MFFDGFIKDFNEYLFVQKKRDQKFIKRVEKRLTGNTNSDKRFSKRVSDVHVAMDRLAFEFSEVLKDYLDNPFATLAFGSPFSQAIVIGVLKDKEFIAFLFEANLIRRTLKLDYDTKGEIKQRIYLAIMNFDEYKKQKWCG